MYKRYQQLQEEIEDEPIVDKVMLDEEFIPPHKSAAFTPYDCVLCVTPSYGNMITAGSSSVKEDDVFDQVEVMIEDVEYNRIVAVVENETSEPGDFLVYISLETFEEYKSRW